MVGSGEGNAEDDAVGTVSGEHIDAAGEKMAVQSDAGDEVPGEELLKDEYVWNVASMDARIES